MTDLEDRLRREAKRELRKRMRALRKATPAAQTEARSAEIVQRLLALERLATARSVAVFYPMLDKHEVDLRPLVTALRARGVVVAYPRVDGPHEASFRVVGSEVELVEGSLGEREAPEAAPHVEALEVVIVPALALAPSGDRLGYGGGFYDGLLARYRGAWAVGVAFDFQLLAELPTTEGDRRVQFVVTDRHQFDPEERTQVASIPPHTREGGVATIARPRRGA